MQDIKVQTVIDIPLNIHGLFHESKTWSIAVFSLVFILACWSDIYGDSKS